MNLNPVWIRIRIHKLYSLERMLFCYVIFIPNFLNPDSDFVLQDPDDLPFKKGEILTVVSKDEEQWWTARHMSLICFFLWQTLISFFLGSE